MSNTPEKQVHDKIVSNVTDRGKEGTIKVFDEVFDRLEKLEKLFARIEKLEKLTVKVFDEVFDRLEKLEKAQQKVIKKK